MMTSTVHSCELIINVFVQHTLCIFLLCIPEVVSESEETIESVVVAIDPGSGLTSPASNEKEDCDDHDHNHDLNSWLTIHVWV